MATLAWNGYRHFELYYAARRHRRRLHTLNPRLLPDQLAYIANHAEDTALFFDLTFLPLVEAIAPRCQTVQAFVLMTDREHMPAASKVRSCSATRTWSPRAAAFPGPSFDENAAGALCYTSGTTGDPKGVLYSHRSTVLHAYPRRCPTAAPSPRRILPVVPLFHANAWGLPYTAPLSGAKFVFPGPTSTANRSSSSWRARGVDRLAGVPTVWLGLLEAVEAARPAASRP